jgi:hypothetical protein
MIINTSLLWASISCIRIFVNMQNYSDAEQKEILKHFVLVQRHL